VIVCYCYHSLFVVAVVVEILKEIRFDMANPNWWMLSINPLQWIVEWMQR
jgi:hypothetical protein